MKMDLQIEDIDNKVADRIKQKWDSIAKPLDGLGKFEKVIMKIGSIQGIQTPNINKRAVIVMCADNGIVEEGVSQSGQEITSIVAKNMGKHITSVCKMADVAGADVIPVDIGINTNEKIEGILHKKISLGTKNFLKEPAMTMEECKKAIQTGIDLVEIKKREGYTILATGEMGIGNTTTSCAIAAALLNLKADEITGPGAGLSDEGVRKKARVIQQAIDQYALYQKDAFTVLQYVGGLDIAGLVGIFIGGAIYHVPVVLDGVISAVAALVAEEMLPLSKKYMIASHMSREPVMDKIMKRLELTPVLYADMALGEGTGAVMLFPLLDMVMAVYGKETTFTDIKMQAYERFH